jgi:peroxiredoxin Q/BCP
MSKTIKVGDKAPDFALPDQDGKPLRLSDLIGKKVVVLYFYPKDFTRGCTEEACSFRDTYQIFKDAGAEVVGVSSDSTESHKKFAEEYKLPFELLSDSNGEVRELYGASSWAGIPGRITFVIDRTGTIRMVFSSQLQPTKHIQEALQIIKEIGGKD